MRMRFVARFALSFLVVGCLMMGERALAQFSKATVLLTGKVTDAETHEPLKARVSFIDASGVEKNKVMTNSEGKYSAVLAPGVNYTVKLVATQRYVGSDAISFPASDKFQQGSHDFTVRPIHSGTIMVDANGCFECGSVAPTAKYSQDVVTAGKIMAGNEEIEVTIETFSDDAKDGVTVPADQGTQRAEALKAILIANGARKNRITLVPHNPPPPPAAAKDDPAGKGKKKAKAVKKPKPAKKPVKGKKGADAACFSKAQIKIINVHSEDE